jgi:hypothetical protein
MLPNFEVADHSEAHFEERRPRFVLTAPLILLGKSVMHQHRKQAVCGGLSDVEPRSDIRYPQLLGVAEHPQNLQRAVDGFYGVSRRCKFRRCHGRYSSQGSDI